MRNVLFVILGIVGTVVCLSLMCNPAGIVSLEGYSHAVAVCGDEELEQSKDIDKVAHMRVWDGNTFTINWGHVNDSEVKRLRLLAKSECEKESN